MDHDGTGAREKCGHFEERGDSKEAGEAATVDVIVTDAKTEDVRLIDLAAVVLDLFVALEGLLRSQQVGPGQLHADVKEKNLVIRQRVKETCTLGSIPNQVMEFEVPKPETIGPRPLVPISADGVRLGVVIVIHQIVVAEIASDKFQL